MRQTISMIFLVVLCSHTSLLYAQQPTQTFRGIVVDADSKQSLEGVAVVCMEDNKNATVTDQQGKFRLTGITVGRHNFEFSLLGYHNRIIRNIEITSGKEIVLTVEITEKVFEAKMVEITATKSSNLPNNEMAVISVRNFNSEETNRFAGSRGDPSRLAATTAGVSSGNDARNDIVVRGNSPLGVLWRLENIDIPNPNHFSAQGATGGPISILNNNLLAGSDFYTGAWPAEYGNKNAAVFDLKLRNGNNEKHEYTGQVGINGFELGAEGPFKKNYNGSYLINYRYSTLDAFRTLGINFGVSGQPRYQDLSGKINVPTKNAGVFSLWGIGGISSISLLDNQKQSSDWSFTNAGTDLVYGSSMAALGVSNTHYYNTKTYGKISIATTAAGFKATVDTIAVNQEKFRTFNSNSTDHQFHAQYNLNSKINSRNLLRATATFTQLNMDYSIKQYNRVYKQTIDLLNQQSSTSLLQASLGMQHKLSEILIMNFGLHYQQLLLNGSQAFEPRIGIRWIPAKGHAINAGYGLHHQMQPLINYFYKSYNQATGTYMQNNLQLDFTRSQHYVIGYEYNTAKNWRFKSECYYQQQSKIPVRGNRADYFSMINQGSDIGGLELVDSLVNNGLGKNYGIEITIEKTFSKNYYLLCTTSLFESRYKGSDMHWYYSAFSSGFVGNMLAGYEHPIKQGKYKVSFDIKSTLAGGNRYIPVDEASSVAAGKTVYFASLAYAYKFRNFKKTDIKIAFKYNGKHISQSFFVSLENIFNQQNILRQYYDPRLQQLKTEYQFGLFPIGGYRIEF